MTTTIVPGVGQGVVFTQQGAGVSPGYAAIDVRRSDSVGLQEGVYNASDFMVVQRGAGANMSVDIGMPTGGGAEVQGDTVNGQGLYYIPVHSATINETIATADATNPRVDQVILEIQDNVHDASGGNLARTRILTGTPTAGATLTNRNGAAALPGSALLLADVLVGAAVSSIGNTVIRDRRKWARGIDLFLQGNNGSTFTTTSTVYGQLALGIFDCRLECSGAPLDIDFNGNVNHSAVNGVVIVQLNIDAVEVYVCQTQAAGAGQIAMLAAEFAVIPAAGSHLFTWQWKIVTAGTGSLNNSGHLLPTVRYREQVRQNTANNTVTTG
jgi:hypothetical protein